MGSELGERTIKSNKLLYIYPYCNIGGVTSVIKQRMPSLIMNDWEVDVIFQYDFGGKSELLQSGLKDVQIFNSAFINQIRKLISTRRYDLITVFDIPELIPILKACTKVPLIYEIHTPTETKIRKNITSDLIMCEAIFTPSQWSKDTLLQIFSGLDSDKINVLPNIVDDNIFSLKGETFNVQSPTVLWVGKFSPYKNWEEALLIISELLQYYEKLSSIWVTGGSYNESNIKKLINQVISKNLSNRFCWLHNIEYSEMAKIYRGVAKQEGFLLSASLAESFCLVVHEAMMCGLPVIATDVGPINDVIDHKVSGLLFKSGNLNSAINYCIQLLEYKELRKNIIEAMPASLARFNSDRLRNLYVDTISSVLNGV